jgi:pseudouridine-5'-monophosphatase
VALESLNAERRSKGLNDITPEECLGFEDGVPGVQAGRAAGCTVIWVPHAEALKVLDGKEKDIIGDQGEIPASLADLDKAKNGF